MKVPSGLISKITPEYRQFTMQTFDWSLLIFQVILVLLPFALVGIFIVEPDTFTSIAVFLGGLSLIGYWIARNFLGRYTILLADTYVEFRSGWPARIKRIDFRDIERIRIRRRTGKVASGGRIMHTTVGPDVDDYYLVTNEGEMLIIPLATRRVKEFIRQQVLEVKARSDSQLPKA